jgi:hypothetical protein
MGVEVDLSEGADSVPGVLVQVGGSERKVAVEVGILTVAGSVGGLSGFNSV